MTTNSELRLKGFSYHELFTAEGLSHLDADFLQHLPTDLKEKLQTYRQSTHTFSTLDISDLLIRCSYFLENFLGALFDINEALAISQVRTIEHNPISAFKKYYVLRRAKKEMARSDALLPYHELEQWLNAALRQNPLQSHDKELAIALLGQHYLAHSEQYADEINKLVQWCVYALQQPTETKNWASFHIPERMDYAAQVAYLPENAHSQRLMAPLASLRQRDGFQLTDPRMSAREVQDEINYCIYCHDHDGDFCSKGFPVKKGDPSQGFKKNPLDVLLTGCPLEEKISEAHYLKKDGHTLAALAMIMVDNPMCPATGHRICNDCMKACIYQKQEPVNIPQIETRILTDALDLPWGVEIYDLLTRWNPLRQKQWLTKPYNGLKMMIAGMGPAGFTLAHHLLQEGFAVVGFDGLKIEPLPASLIKQPIKHFSTLKESLDQRIMAGFGGVAEYGITVRWDKNFLKLIYLSLARRPYFQVFGGVRFGGTLTVEDVFAMGFDHFAIAVGAGLPKALSIPGSMAPGMRQANDFLMALQLGNAAKASSLTNLQVRLPALVIGGGLTGVDTATELQAYYISLVEKVCHRYEILSKEYGDAVIRQQLDAASQIILDEYLQHGLAVRKERQRAKEKCEQPNFIQLIRAFGGVTIVYRRSIQESPAYINNSEELKKALQEGIYYLEALEPAQAELDEFGHVQALVCHQRACNEAKEWVTTTEEVRLPARSILVATGTQPNTAYEFEHRGTFNRINMQYQHYEDDHGELRIAHGVLHAKDPQFGPFTSYHKDQHRVSLVGDTHPVFHGNVVKAIASGMRTYPKILAIFADKANARGVPDEYEQFAQRMAHLFQAKIVSTERKTDDVLELTIKAPLAVKHFKPGHFYRLQNFETTAVSIGNTSMQMEPLALVAAEANRDRDELRFIVKQESVAAKLCSLLQAGDVVSLMGPAGVRAKMPVNKETILIIGTQSSFAFLQSYSQLARSLNHQIIFLGLFHHKKEVYCQQQLEDAAHIILWATETEEHIPSNRPQDLTMTATSITAALDHYAKHNSAIALHDVDRIFLVGHTALLKEFQTQRKTFVKNYFIKDPEVVGSVYGNMQCMLKGVCAQCLQWQIDPETGLRTKAVFACSWQDQPLELIDIDHLDARFMQNRLLERLSSLWVDHILE